MLPTKTLPIRRPRNALPCKPDSATADEAHRFATVITRNCANAGFKRRYSTNSPASARKTQAGALQEFG